MNPSLPKFRYHPDPLATGAVEQSDVRCVCCGERRGYLYVGPVYGEHDLNDSLCPWCIADGLAAKTLSASFADDHTLLRAGVPSEVVEEVTLRTPGYSSWQGEDWLVHCRDACAFAGDATVSDVSQASEHTRMAWQEFYGLGTEEWEVITRDYVPRGAQAFYKFRCLHCAAILLGWDCL